MLALSEVIKAEKADIVISGWKNGKIPAAAFPLSRKNILPASTAWQWRTVQFNALGREFKLLVRLNLETEYYSAILGLVSAEGLKIICHHELHISHRNWHCHFIRGDVETTFPGVLRDRNRMEVYEACPSQSANVMFTVDVDNALTFAGARFRFPAPDETPAQKRLWP